MRSPSLRFPAAVLLLAILCLATASAATLYDQWVLAGKSFLVSGLNVSVDVDDSWERLIVDSAEDNFIILKGDCKKGSYYQYCYLDSRWELFKYGAYDQSTAKKTPEVHVTVKDISPIISLSASADKSSLALNEELTVTLKVKNTGDYQAGSLTYSETLSDNVTVMSAGGGASFSGRTVTWESTSLKGGDEKSFTYTLRLDKTGTLSVGGGNLTYSFEGDTFVKSASPQSITTRETIQFKTFSLSKTSSSIDENVVLTAVLGNNDPTYDVRVTIFNISIPGTLALETIGEGLTESGRSYGWAGTLSPGENRTFTLTVRPVKSGSYAFDAVLDAMVRTSAGAETRYNTSRRQTLSAALTKLSPSIVFMLNRAKVDAGEKTSVKAYLKNPDKKTTYVDVSYVIDTDLFDPVRDTLSFINPDTQQLVLFKEFLAPVVGKSGVHLINFTGTYRTRHDETFSFGATATLTVDQEVFQQILALNHSLPAEIREGESVEVILTAKDLQDFSVTALSLADSVTGAEVTAGTPSAQIASLTTNITREAYRYTLTVPLGTNESAVEVRTAAEFLFKGQPLTVYEEKAARILKADQQAEQPVEQPQPVAQPPPAEKPKESLVKRIINGIVRFVKGMW